MGGVSEADWAEYCHMTAAKTQSAQLKLNAQRSQKPSQFVIKRQTRLFRTVQKYLHAEYRKKGFTGILYELLY